MKDDVTPFQAAACRVGIHVEDALKAVLQWMEDNGIVCKHDPCNDPSPQWLSLYTIIKKPNGQLQIAMNPTELNKALLRPICRSKVLDNIAQKF